MKQFFDLKSLIMILLGNAIYAVGIVAFVLPNHMILGGTTGIALTLQHFYGINLSVFVLIFNILMFLLGYIVLGRKFALTTIVSSVVYPFFLGTFEKIAFLQDMTEDMMLATIFAGIMIGFGLGLVIREGASTGGMDIPPLIVNKKLGISVSVMMYVFDFSILICQMFFSNKEQSLYGIFLILIYTVVLDKMIVRGTAMTEVRIISKKYEEINQHILREMDCGSTLVEIETGFKRSEEMMIMTIIHNRELVTLNNMILSIDPQAFIIIEKVNEVKGKGFSLPKVNLA